MNQVYFNFWTKPNINGLTKLQDPEPPPNLEFRVAVTRTPRTSPLPTPAVAPPPPPLAVKCWRRLPRWRSAGGPVA